MKYNEFSQQEKKMFEYQYRPLGHLERWILLRLSDEAIPFHILQSEYDKEGRKGIIKVLRKLEDKGFIGIYDLNGMLYVARIDKLQEVTKGKLQ